MKPRSRTLPGWRWGWFAVGLAVTLPAQAGTAPADDAKRAPFARFVGVCQAGPSEHEIWDYISWVRLEPSWSSFQPNGPDEWNQDALDRFGRTVLEYREQRVNVLPCLDYMQQWAARRRPWTFIVTGKRYDVAAYDGDISKRRVTVTDLASGIEKEITFGTARMPPEDVADWENYVERVVSFLRAPPYNVEYFQVWNEANDSFTGFWIGGMDEYMTTIHLPAAKIIRKHGGKVVYGGYPCNGTMTHYLDVLDKHQAWDTLDVLDIHYFPLSAWDLLYERTRGRDLAIWQTEAGFTTAKGWVPNGYPRFFYWALTHDWEPDRYRLFQFAYWSPNDPKAYGYNCCFLRGDELTYHGQAFVTLGRLLNTADMRPFTEFSTKPLLRPEINERASSVEGFRDRDRIVLALHLAYQNGAALFTDWNRTRDNLHLDWPDTKVIVTLPALDPGRVAAARRVGIYDSRTELAVTASADGVTVLVPTADPDPTERQDNRASKMHTFYLLLELEP